MTTTETHMTTCTDCGAEVPTIRTGEGYPDLPRCPQTTSRFMTGHTVTREAFDAAKAEAAR